MLDENRVTDGEGFDVGRRVDKSSKKQLLGYIRGNLSKGYSIEAINKALIRYGYDKLFVNYLMRTYKKHVNVIKYSILAFIILLFSFNLFFIQATKIGFITLDKEFDYIDAVNLTIDDNYNYRWLMSHYGELRSVRLDGAVSKDGHARVYLDNESYLIFDNSRLSKEGIGGISGLVVCDKTSYDYADESELVGNDKNKSIMIRLRGGGVKAIDDVFEFNIDSRFNWEVDYGRVCIKWDINSRSVCYGAGDCCAFIGLESLGNWDDSFYLSYGRYGSGLDNIVRAQVIYADYSLDIEEPYTDIVYSGRAELKAKFCEFTGFEDMCIDTCLLRGLNGTAYELLFILENASLRIDNIRYSIKEGINISLNAPSLVKDIENITVYRNEEFVINLSEYFADDDGDLLGYGAYEVKNISVVIENSIARIVPAINFTGRRYMYFTASDGYYNVSSNMFFINVIERPLKVEEVNVSEELVKPQVVINKPVRWVKLVNASDSVINLSVNISSDALNVTVRNVKEGKVVSEDKIKVNENGTIKNVSTYVAERRIEKIRKIEKKLETRKSEIMKERPTAKKEIADINEGLLEIQNERNRLSGYVVVDERELLRGFFGFFSKEGATGYAVAETENLASNITAVIIEDIVEDVEIEYYTEGPYSEEENISFGKRIIVNSDIHYEDVLAYTYLDEVPQSSIMLYHIVNGGRELVDNVSYYDENSNNLIDRIEWIVPSLSNQTYEVSITILNVHSYPSSYGNWTVMFDTTGVANLTITATKESNYTEEYTRWSTSSEDESLYDLKFLEVRCGGTSLDYSWYGENCSEDECSVFIADYSCNETGYEVSKVLTARRHVLKFNFGGLEAYAYNAVQNISNCTTLSSSGVYYLNVSITDSTQSYCMEITANDVVLDCQGYRIDGDGIADYGIYIERASSTNTNITIRNCTITDWDSRAVSLAHANNNTFDGVNLSSNPDSGIYLFDSDNNNITNSRFVNNSYGIYVDSSGNNTIYNNFFNNTNNVYFGGTTYNNTWNISKISGTNIINGSYLGGNFWATPSGTGHSEGCNDTNGDAICDETYTLAASNIDYLPLIVPDTNKPSVHLIVPANNTNTSNSTQRFICNITDNRWIANLTLYIWNSTGDVNYTNTTNLSGTVNSTNWTYTLPYDDSFLWNCLGYDAAGNYNWSSEGNYTVTLDTTAPVVNLISPANNTRTAIAAQTFICNISDNYWLGNLTLYVWNSTGDNILTNTTNVSGTSNSTSFTYTLPYDGTFNWSCLGYDLVGNYNWSSRGNYTIILDTSSIWINFTYPTPDNNTKITNTSVQINISIKNASNLDTFIWNWNGTNYTFYNDSLVLMMNFDNVSAIGENYNNSNGSIIVDLSEYVNNGTLYVGDAYSGNYTDGRYGGAYSFDGVDDYVNVAVTPNKNTTSFWYKNSTASSWTHVVNVSGTVYVNSISGLSYQYPIYISGNSVEIGKTGSSTYFNGSIDEVRIWNRSLSAAEVKQHYYSSLRKYDTDKWYFLVNETVNEPYINATYTYYGYAENTAGKSNQTETRYWTIQAVPPAITIVSPINDSRFNTSVVDFNVSTNENTSWCGLSLDDGANVSMNRFNDTWFNHTNSSMSEGWHSVIVYCNDTRGNMNSSDTYRLLVDTYYPNIAFVGQTLANASTTAGSHIFVNVSVNDTTSNVSTFIDFDNSLVSWWRFDEVSGSTVTDYMGRNDGTAYGNAAQTRVGYHGQGFSFDGNGDYVDIPGFAIGRNSTFVAWAKVSVGYTPNDSGIITDGGSLENGLSLENATVVQFRGDSTAGANRAAVDMGAGFDVHEWHQYVGVSKDGIGLYLYIDGVLKNSSTTSFVNTNLTNGTEIGHAKGHSARYFKGTIDDVMIFNRSLSEEEVRGLYANQSDTYLAHNFTNLTDGWHTFKAYAQDYGGNVNYTATRSVLIDTTYPVINFTSPTPANGTATTNTSFEINISITELNLVEFKWNWNGTNYTLYNDSLVLMMNFDNVSAIGEGYTGNASKVVDVSKYMNNGTWVTNGTNEDNYSIWNSSGRYDGAFRFDGVDDYVNVAVTPNKNTTSFWYKNSTASSWTHVVNISGTIYVNGITGASYQYPIYISGNSVEIGKTGASTYFNGTIDEVRIWNRTLSAAEVKQHYYSNLKKYDTDKWYFWINETVDEPYINKSYNYSGYARDIAGNENNTGVRKITIDGVPPAITIIYPVNNSRFNVSVVDFNVSTNENTSWCGLSLDDGADVSMNRFNDTWFNHTNSSMSEGRHSVIVYCNDSRGNMNSSDTYRLLVDTIYPGINFTNITPVNNSAQNYTYIFVNVSSSDANNISTVIDFDDSLVSWWRFDDISGSTVTDYMRRNDGTAYGNAAQTNAGYFGKGFSFDGNADYVYFTEVTLAGEFTLGGWYYATSLATYNNLWDRSSDDNNKIHIEDDGELFIRIGGTTSANISMGGFSNNTWHYLVLVRNSSNDIIIYKDGSQVNSTNISGIFYVDGVGDDSDFVNDWNGRMDDVMIFNRSLSADEIRGLYANVSSKFMAHNFTNLTDGAHTFRAYAQDLGGNVNSTETRTVTVDTTAPTITATSPSGTVYVSSVNINITTDENATCRYIPSTEGNISTDYTNMTYNFSDNNLYHNVTVELANGYYEYYARCIDIVGNVMSESANISFTVDVVTTTTTTTAGGGGGGAATVEKNISKNVLLEIRGLLNQTILSGDEIQFLIALENKGELKLNNIILYTETNAPNVSLSLSKNFFEGLEVNEKDELSLKIRSLVDPKARIGRKRYYVILNANVVNPFYNTSKRFFIDVEERSYQMRMESLQQIEFVEDLFREHPECLELNEVIKQAQEMYDNSEYEKAIELIDAAIQACRDLVAFREEEEIEKPAPKKKLDTIIFIIEMVILLILMAGMFYYYKRRGGKKPEGGIKSNLELRFDDLFRETEKFIKSGDLTNAKNNYLSLYSLYKTIMTSSLTTPMKSYYHKKLLILHSRLSTILRER